MVKETLTVRIEPATRDALDAIATALDRDRSYSVNDALARNLDMHRWQIEHIPQGADDRPLPPDGRHFRTDRATTRGRVSDG